MDVLYLIIFPIIFLVIVVVVGNKISVVARNKTPYISLDLALLIPLLILIGIIVVIAMQFMAPTIGNVWIGPDPCGPTLCPFDYGTPAQLP